MRSVLQLPPSAGVEITPMAVVLMISPVPMAAGAALSVRRHGPLQMPGCVDNWLQSLPQVAQLVPHAPKLQSSSIWHDAPVIRPPKHAVLVSKHDVEPLPAGNGGSCVVQFPVVSSGLLQIDPGQSVSRWHGLPAFVPPTHSPPPCPAPTQVPLGQSLSVAHASPARVPPLQAPGPLLTLQPRELQLYATDPQSASLVHGAPAVAPPTLFTHVPGHSASVAQDCPLFDPSTQVCGGVVLWSKELSTLALDRPAALHPINPEDEFPGPCTSGSATPCGQAHASPGTLTA